MSDHFRYFFRVKFHECDPQGIVFNSRYGEYASVAACEFMRALKRPEGPSCVLVRQVIEWRSPARFDDVLFARVVAQELGESSFTLSIDFVSATSQTAIARAASTYVLLDRKSRTSCALPTELREALMEGADGICVDHASHLQQAQAQAA